ncbi:tetratricopeptide repeat protein [Vibrio salinus]|uniref:tetratricopeptide repeat protein n=1 Tax=Vibrio salinus TaxID=2899784 RepID=UPI001E509AC9|nr:tetratricopeptide repeat protein [Vibrio salinus]MCE0495028.1 sel1 repeat family protein [Vibrio salinus]
MNVLGIFIGIAGVLLVVIVSWMIALSIKQNRIQTERKKKQDRRRLQHEHNRQQEKQQRREKAENGHIPTILFLAKEAERTDWRESFYWYEKAANLDNIMGMYGVVRMSRHLDNDLIVGEKARFWQTYIQGIEGDNPSLLAAGKAWIHGLGISANLEKGLEVVENAARKNYIPAMIYLGDWNIAKDNPNQKSEDSNYWYAKAAKLEDPEAMMKLGINYLRGVGTPPDHNKACYWLESAAETGYPEAMYHAGDAWIDHGSHGNAIAYIWLFLAAYFHNEPARILRDEVGNKVGVDSIIALQRFAKPLITKIQTGTVGKHLIIRALNKLYKRDVPVFSHNQFHEEQSVSDSCDELVNEIKTAPSDSPEASAFSYSGTYTEDNSLNFTQQIEESNVESDEGSNKKEGSSNGTTAPKEE